MYHILAWISGLEALVARKTDLLDPNILDWGPEE
jgi:hypothetical protein